MEAAGLYSRAVASTSGHRLRLVFVCGAMEPGRNGVGDYVRLLAAELIKQGHRVSVVALYDRDIDTSWSGVQSVNDVEVPVLRLYNYRNDSSQHLLKEWLRLHRPFVASLQFVPFAFQKKGLPYRLDRFLVQIFGGVQWHVMFHELWLGIDREASLKYRTWGWVQQRLVLRLLRRLNPTLIHTQSSVYQRQLAGSGINAALLPLFSNIPPPSSASVAKCRSSHTLVFTTFGSINPGSPVRSFVSELAQYAAAHKLSVVLKMVGRGGAQQQPWASVWEAQGVEVHQLNEQAGATIAQVLASSDFGITTTPFEQVEKSGTVAAMKEHGLPVICVARDWSSRNGNPNNVIPEGIRLYKQGAIKTLIEQPAEKAFVHRLQDIAEHFQSAITTALYTTLS